MHVTGVFAFAVACAVLVAIPGPSVLFTISRALTVGRRGAVATVVGNALGAYVQVVAVAVGIGALVQESAEVFTIVKLVGAAYIVFLGLQAIWQRHSLADSFTREVEPVGRLRATWDGFVVGVANPKSIAFFVVVLPQFGQSGHGWVSVPMLIVGAIFPAMTVVLNSGWAFAAGTARAWFGHSARRLSMVGGISGLCMVGLGVSLAFVSRKG